MEVVSPHGLQLDALWTLCGAMPQPVRINFQRGGGSYISLFTHASLFGLDAGCRWVALGAAGWRWVPLGGAGCRWVGQVAANLSYFSNTCAKCCRSISELLVFLEHVCKVLPFDIRICGISRTRVQNAAAFIATLRLTEFKSIVFLGHVCKLQPLELRIRCISRTRVHSAAVRYPNLSYFANTCARPNYLSSEFVVFREHVCRVLPFDIRICRISRIRVQNAAA